MKLGLYLGSKPAQRTLWFWTAIPMGVFVISWLAFFLNGGLEGKKEAVPQDMTFSKAAPTVPLDTPNRTAKLEIAAKPVVPQDMMTVKAAKDLAAQVAKEAAKDAVAQVVKKYEEKEKEKEKAASERRAEKNKKSESQNSEVTAVNKILPAIITPAAAPIPGVPDSVISRFNKK